MPKFNNLVGLLAISAALAGGAVTLGTTVTATAANAGTVMGGYVGPSYAPTYKRVRGAKAKKKKNKQWQHERQNQHQRQFLLRDFTLVLTPFQKTESDSRALPYNWQATDTKTMPYNRQLSNVDTQTDPQQKQNVTTDVNTTPTPTPTPTVTVTLLVPSVS